MEKGNQQLEIFDLLNVHLPIFDGPLDLLLDLIRKKKMDIREIPLTEICEPYLDYLNLMEAFNMDIAIEFLDIASTLILIKSKTLLPRKEDELTDEEDPLDTEEKLRQKLIEYQKFKTLAENLNQRALMGRDVFSRVAEVSDLPASHELLIDDLSVYNLIKAYLETLQKKAYHKPHEISKEEFPIEQKILELMKIFQSGQIQLLQNLYPPNPIKSEIIIAFMAILELAKMLLLQIQQIREFGPVHCKPSPTIGEFIPLYQEQVPNAS